MEQKKNRVGTKIGLTLIVLAMLGVAGTIATWAAFSDTTVNSGNIFQAGSVDIDDGGTGTTPLYDLFDGTPNARPGDSDSGCIKLTFQGSLASDVKLFGSNDLSANALADQLTLKITSGSGAAAAGDCTGAANFTTSQTAGNVYDGSLSNFMSTSNAFGNGVTLDDGTADADTQWSNGDAVTYKFAITLTDDADVNDANSKTATGFSTGNHSFTFEAQS